VFHVLFCIDIEELLIFL
jgi:hypothetical protein